MTKTDRRALAFWLPILAVYAVILLWTQVVNAHHDDGRYRVDVREAVDRYWPSCGHACHWHWYYAQLKQESSLNPDAVSPAGAVGLAQAMPPTWGDWQKKGWVPVNVSRRDAKWSIVGGARYMRSRMDVWGLEGRTWLDKGALGRACYNAGCVHLITAQRLCGDPRPYADIIKCLPQVTGDHSRETIQYEQRIRAIRARL